MGILNFFINGGLFGYMESYDHKKEGHPYNLDNLHRTLGSVRKCADELSCVAHKFTPNVTNILSKKN